MKASRGHLLRGEQEKEEEDSCRITSTCPSTARGSRGGLSSCRTSAITSSSFSTVKIESGDHVKTCSSLSVHVPDLEERRRSAGREAATSGRLLFRHPCSKTEAAKDAPRSDRSLTLKLREQPVEADERGEEETWR